MDEELDLAVPPPSRDNDGKLVELFRKAGRESQVLAQPRPSPCKLGTVNDGAQRTHETAAHARDNLIVHLALLGGQLLGRGKVKSRHVRVPSHAAGDSPARAKFRRYARQAAAARARRQAARWQTATGSPPAGPLRLSGGEAFAESRDP